MPDPKRGDGNFHITINDMGHGDGTIIAFPNGKKVLIDFGSRRFDTAFFTLEEEEEEPEEPEEPEERKRTPQQQKQLLERIKDYLIKNIVCDKRYLLTDPFIDVIILTHSDEDHHKVLQTLFKTQIKLKGGGWSPIPQAGTVFFSGDFKAYSVGGTNRFLAGATDYIYSVSINEKGACYSQTLFEEYTYVQDKPVQITEKRIEIGGELAETFIEKVKAGVMKGFVKVMDGTLDPKDPCGLYLLASNVTTDYANDDNSEVNRRSIVSMIVGKDGKKFLFLGDATRSTETFLMTQYAGKLKNFELVQVGHHASMSSSSKEFIQLINPKIAVVSAPYQSEAALPRYEVLERFEEHASELQILSEEIAQVRHPIACYMPVTYKPKRSNKWKRLNRPKGSKRKAEPDTEPDTVQERPHKRLKKLDGSAAKPEADEPPLAEQPPLADEPPMAEQPRPWTDIAEFDTNKAIWCTGTHGPFDYPDPAASSQKKPDRPKRR